MIKQADMFLAATGEELKQNYAAAWAEILPKWWISKEK
jgi:hypothetical protein